MASFLAVISLGDTVGEDPRKPDMLGDSKVRQFLQPKSY